MLLKNGSNGEDVKKLQQKLGLEDDGDFGPVTESKVKEWQTQNGIAASGIVDDLTWQKMFGNQLFKLDGLKGKIPDSVISQIPDTAQKFNITNSLRLAHFLSQCGHESGGFKVVNENLNYSSDGLKKIFPKYFPGALNESYARQPQKIANRVYSSRMGNGDENSGDGFKFRGRGYIQLTGKSNYQSFDKMVEEDILANPDLVATKYPLMSAAFFFDSNKLWSICDRGSDRATVEAVTKRVNGGLIGIEDRWKHFNEYYSILR
jgi:putative chitinase